MAKDLVKIKGVEVKKGKPQHLVIDQVYEVTKETADLLIKNKQGVKA